MKKDTNQESEMQFDIHMHRYFLSPTDAVIANEITDLFMSGKQITESIIREKARFHFYRPHVLPLKERMFTRKIEKIILKTSSKKLKHGQQR